MSPTLISALAGLAGAAIGGFASFGTSWLTLRTQLREQGLETIRKQREKLFVDFMGEAARLYGDALGHERDDIADLVKLYALAAHIRMVSSHAVTVATEHVIDAVIATYHGPNRTMQELRDFAAQGGMNPLREFGEACRRELGRIRSVTAPIDD